MLGLKKVFSFGQKNNKETPVKEEHNLSPFEEEMLRRAAEQEAKEQKEKAPSESSEKEKSSAPLDTKIEAKTVQEEVSPSSIETSSIKVPAKKATAKIEPKQDEEIEQSATQPVQETNAHPVNIVETSIKKINTNNELKAPIEDTSKTSNETLRPDLKLKDKTDKGEEKNTNNTVKKIDITPKAKTTSPKISETFAEPTVEKAPEKKAQKVTVHEHVSEKPDIVVIEEKIAPKKLPWIQRLRQGLFRSSKQLGESISGIFTKRKLDEDTLQDLEDVLIQADLGVETAIRITDALASGRYGKDIAPDEVRTIMGTEITKVLTPVAQPLELDLSHKPHVILVVGVNGTGKTTTIGKLAAKLTAGGLKVMLAAGDTFRAAAIEQLHIWGKRTNSQVVSTKLGADAASLAYEAYEKAKEEDADVLIIDTAGRLQNKTELMDELAKIVRVLGKHDPDAPHTVLQTLDATTGQNALNQVEIFRNIAGVNGLVMTKLDGTARGGILVAIAAKHKLPVYFIGVGEGIDDLEPFKASDFAEAIAGFH